MAIYGDTVDQEDLMARVTLTVQKQQERHRAWWGGVMQLMIFHTHWIHQQLAQWC